MTGEPSVSAVAPSVLLVVGANGGCGASLVAGALALAYARAGAGAWLLELDLGRGDRGEAWGTPRGRTLADLVDVAGELDARHLRHAAHTRPDGLQVLNAPPGPGAGAWPPDAIDRLLAAARIAAGDAGRVIVDGGAGLRPPSRAVCTSADRTLVVCSPTVPAVRRARRIVEALAAPDAGARCGLVVCRGPAPQEIGARALGRAAGAPVLGELPWVPREAGRLAAGHWPTGRRRRLVTAVEALAGAVA